MSNACREIDLELDGALSTRPEARSSWRLSGKLSDPAVAHLGKCERCRRLYQWMLESAVPRESVPAIASAIQAKLKQSLTPVKPQASNAGPGRPIPIGVSVVFRAHDWNDGDGRVA